MDALAGIDLGLPVQRQMIGIFRHQNLGDGFGRQAALDQPAGASACMTTSQARQAYLGRRVTTTRNCANTSRAARFYPRRSGAVRPCYSIEVLAIASIRLWSSMARAQTTSFPRHRTRRGTNCSGALAAIAYRVVKAQKGAVLERRFVVDLLGADAASHVA